MSKHIVFSYGSLKRGEPNHYHLHRYKGSEVRYLGKGVTVEKYPLVVAGRYCAPHLLDKPGFGKVSCSIKLHINKKGIS